MSIIKPTLLPEIEWFLDYMKVEKGGSRHTLSAYESDLKEFAVLLEDHLEKWVQIDRSHLRLIDAHLAAIPAVTTRRRKASALRSFLRFLKKNRVPIEIDLGQISEFKTGKRLPKALPSEKTADLLSEFEGDGDAKAVRDRVLFELVYAAGLRISEAVGLQLKDVDLDSGTLRVEGKRGKVRVIPVPSPTMERLKQYLELSRPQLIKKGISNVILSDRGLALSRQLAWKKIQYAAKATGITGSVGPHTLRHSYAVDLLKGGADLRVVQELLGHASVATTQIYTELSDDTIATRYLASHPRQ